MINQCIRGQEKSPKRYSQLPIVLLPFYSNIFLQIKACYIVIYNFKLYLQVPFPEDVVRCHAVMQALAMDLCHCVYANKTYTIGMKNSIEVLFFIILLS